MHLDLLSIPQSGGKNVKAYKIMLSRSGAHTKRAGEQTNSVITYYCAVSVPSRSKKNKQNCMDVSVCLHKWGGLVSISCCAHVF